MRWRGNRQSSNVEDRRGSRASGLGVGGGGVLRLLPMAIKFLGVKGTLIAAALLIGYGIFTGNLPQILGGASLQNSQATQPNRPIKQSGKEKELVQFMSVVLADTEDTWHVLFKQMNGQYKEPRLVLYREAVNSGCGFSSAQMGPFYCPRDQKVYIDLSFYDDLSKRYKAPGDFAQAYVLAHEIGHHVQTLLGISQKVHDLRQRVSTAEANKLSVKMELQADCYAGIWAHHANRSRQILEQGDIDEGLAAASAVGDDRLQKKSQGRVTPDSFTHGSSEQRMKWFTIGYKGGSIKACDTFTASSL